MKFFLLATVFATGMETCCDSKHEGLALAAENTKICMAKGGIPITEPVGEEFGSHTFNILKQCAFPCDQRLAVEKP